MDVYMWDWQSFTILLCDHSSKKVVVFWWWWCSRRGSVQNEFLKNSLYSQEIICVETLFNEVAGFQTSEYCKIFKIIYFEAHLRTAACFSISKLLSRLYSLLFLLLLDVLNFLFFSLLLSIKTLRDVRLALQKN